MQALMFTRQSLCVRSYTSVSADLRTTLLVRDSAGNEGGVEGVARVCYFGLRQVLAAHGGQRMPTPKRPKHAYRTMAEGALYFL